MTRRSKRSTPSTIAGLHWASLFTRSTSRRCVPLGDAHPRQVFSHFCSLLLLRVSRNNISLAKWKRDHKEYFKQHTRLFDKLFDNVRHEIVHELSESPYLNPMIGRTAVSERP